MARIKIKGELHNSKSDFEDLLDASKDDYDEILIEGREEMGKDFQSDPLLPLLHYANLVLTLPLKKIQHGVNREIDFEYMLLEDSLDIIHRETPILKKIWVLLIAFVMGGAIYNLFTVQFLPDIVSRVIATLTIPLWYWVFFLVGSTWIREQKMAEKVTENINTGSDSLYIQVGTIHKTSLSKILESKEIDIDTESANSLWRYAFVPLSIGFRMLSPLKSAKMLYYYCI